MNEVVKKIFCNSRVYSALVALPLLALLIAWMPKWFFLLLLLVILALAMHESWPMFFGERGGFLLHGPVWAISFLMLLAAYWGGTVGLTGSLALALLILVLLLFEAGLESEALPRFALALLFVVYLPFFFSHLLLIWDLPHGRALVALLLMVTWGGDAFSYYCGSYWGKRKLSPRISPNKTIEGFVAGLFGGAFFAVLMNWLGFIDVAWNELAALGVAANFCGQLGDLFESFLKRSHGIKDSGSLIPGHGGFLDRIDSVLFAAPVIFYASTLWIF
ncbi:MAG: phosphatidate cytidylyltransferase [Deltaproteobacteria bacterium]|nr:phosphatidate cytidylyltransferase [Deltaproteobacteria bacterium]